MAIRQAISSAACRTGGEGKSELRGDRKCEWASGSSKAQVRGLTTPQGISPPTVGTAEEVAFQKRINCSGLSASRSDSLPEGPTFSRFSPAEALLLSPQESYLQC